MLIQCSAQHCFICAYLLKQGGSKGFSKQLSGPLDDSTVFQSIIVVNLSERQKNDDVSIFMKLQYAIPTLQKAYI